MDQFLIELAKHARWDRVVSFPDAYRVTTQPGEPNTEAEFKSFLEALDRGEEAAVNYVTKIDLGIVQHNKMSIHENITEYEFEYSFIDNYIRNLKYPERWYLFHGSPSGNWHSILRSGIRNMSGTRFMTHGQASGSGVYAAANFPVAQNYGRNGRTSYVAVIELLVDPGPFYKPDVCYYVIPDDKMLFPRYLLKVTKQIDNDGKEILSYYKKLRDELVKSNTKPKRLLRELDSIDMSKEEPNMSKEPKMTKNITVLEKIHEHCYSIMFGQTLCRLYVFNFPYTCPVLQLVYKTKDEHFDEHGCLKWDYEEWLASQPLAALMFDFNSLVDFDTLEVGKEEYPTLWE